MNKEQKQELINEIVGILNKDAGTMYDGKQPDDEARIALDEDYFEDVAESVFNHLENMFSQKHRKELSRLENIEYLNTLNNK